YTFRAHWQSKKKLERRIRSSRHKLPAADPDLRAGRLRGALRPALWNTGVGAGGYQPGFALRIRAGRPPISAGFRVPRGTPRVGRQISAGFADDLGRGLVGS